MELQKMKVVLQVAEQIQKEKEARIAFEKNAMNMFEDLGPAPTMQPLL